jgi:hypothetical protein
MPRLSAVRVAVTTGLTLGTATLGMALAPVALAAGLPAPTAPSTVVAGQAFQVSGAGCLTNDPDHPDWEAVVIITTDLSDLDAEPPTGLFLAEPADDGTWWAHVSLPADATGPHAVWADCAYSYVEDAAEYPEITVTVATPIRPTPRPLPPSEKPTNALPPATGKIRGVDSVTPGVASPDTGTATGDSARPGGKVVKVLTGFGPGEVVTVTLHSTPTTIGTFTASAEGVVTAEFTVPAGTTEGTHTLVYEGSMGTYFQESLQVADATTASGDLAYTGASIALPLGLGAGLVTIGSGLAFAARRRSAEAPQV